MLCDPIGGEHNYKIWPPRMYNNKTGALVHSVDVFFANNPRCSSSSAIAAVAISSCGSNSASTAGRSESNRRGMRQRVLLEDEGPPGQPDEEASSPGATVAAKTRPLVAELHSARPVNLARLVAERIGRRERFCSFELFPSKAEGVYENFFQETQHCSPLFYALTWHENSSIGKESAQRFPSLSIVERFPRNTLLHCTARGLKRADVKKILDRALELGITNIFALQGDADLTNGDFDYASDLVSFIRQQYDNKFSICVAGYPEMHPESPSKELDLYYLKNKVDTGADFIMTQFFFESQLYIQFAQDCRRVGITVPIIPGIFPITNVKLLKKMTSICRVRIPSWIQEALRDIGDDNEAVRKFGVALSVKIIKEIMDNGSFYGYHVYTLNRPTSVVEVYKQLNEEKDR